jgi:hypothetical protein
MMKELTHFSDGWLSVSLFQGDADSPGKEDLQVTFRFVGAEMTLPAEHLPSLVRAAADAEKLLDYHRRRIPFEQFYRDNDFEFVCPSCDTQQPLAEQPPSEAPLSGPDHEHAPPENEPEPH